MHLLLENFVVLAHHVTLVHIYKQVLEKAMDDVVVDLLKVV